MISNEAVLVAERLDLPMLGLLQRDAEMQRVVLPERRLIVTARIAKRNNVDAVVHGKGHRRVLVVRWQVVYQSGCQVSLCVRLCLALLVLDHGLQKLKVLLIEHAYK